MPPRVKITKQDIIETSVEMVRQSGEGALNARSIASALGCSTQPIFSNFESIEELENEVYIAAYNRYLGFIEREVSSGAYPEYKAFGMAYIRFAREEKELFKLLFMCERNGKTNPPPPDYTASVDILMQAKGITREKAELFHLEMWACVHGIGTMLATSFVELDNELVSLMLTDVYQGLSKRLEAKE